MDVQIGYGRRSLNSNGKSLPLGNPLFNFLMDFFLLVCALIPVYVLGFVYTATVGRRPRRAVKIIAKVWKCYFIGFIVL